MLYGIYLRHDNYGEWVAAQQAPLHESLHNALEIFTTTNQGHALAQLSLWQRCSWLTRHGGELLVAVIGKNGKPSRFVGEENPDDKTT